MSDVDNAHDRETDEWIVPADLKRPPTASVEAPVSDETSTQAPTDPPTRERASTGDPDYYVWLTPPDPKPGDEVLWVGTAHKRPNHAPSLTVAAFEAAMRRDGGQR